MFFYKNKYKKSKFIIIMKDTKKLYEHIMTSVAKEVKKALNEKTITVDFSRQGDMCNIQEDSDLWCNVVSEYLWDHSDASADTSEILGLFATLVYLNQLDHEEIKEIAEKIMNDIDANDDYNNPPVDEAFFEAVAGTLEEEASDWCAEIIKDWKLS